MATEKKSKRELSPDEAEALRQIERDRHQDPEREHQPRKIGMDDAGSQREAPRRGGPLGGTSGEGYGTLDEEEPRKGEP